MLIVYVNLFIMRIRTNGEFKTETIVDIAQRIMAQLQDAGVERVSGLNVYLSIVDKHGAQRDLELDGTTVDVLSIDCEDLTVRKRASQLRVTKATASSYSPQPKRRRDR